MTAGSKEDNTPAFSAGLIALLSYPKISPLRELITELSRSHPYIPQLLLLCQIIPVRCFSCSKVIGDKWNVYLEHLAKDMTEGDALDALQLKRHCHR
ncbi:8 kDa subunit-domain-containing protein [Rhodocollybia butyracea]|uniref:DNA-directed RNA polymerases I, II, and III subunit RPABC5 n=1 Tax=Rhodocollybia butyracea TaxID=206335 RepID=A0A9P5UFC1_9AGAR|nr:8 kDa subunit-domain-containing protein [Rhodocollybia butyracea]